MSSLASHHSLQVCVISDPFVSLGTVGSETPAPPVALLCLSASGGSNNRAFCMSWVSSSLSLSLESYNNKEINIHQNISNM